MDLHLRGKVAVVTGATSGIGKAVALDFAEEGCKIAVCARSKPDLETLTKECLAQGFEVYAESVDVCDLDAVSRFATNVNTHYGRIDIWVNNAGTLLNRSLLDMTPDDWNRVIRTNLTSVFWGTQCAAKCMKETGGGVILNSSSYTALVSASRRGAYTASKAGINGFTKLAAGELAPYGIRVNSVLGGSIATAFQAERTAADLEKVSKKIALHRIGTVKEISKAYLFLASDAASYITGVNLEVSGGKLCIQDPDVPWNEVAASKK